MRLKGTTGPTARFRLRAAAALATCVVAGVAAVPLWGYVFGTSNNEFHFPIVSSIAQGQLWRGDAMVATLPGFASPFWWLVGAVGAWIGPEAAFFWFFVAARILLACGVAYLIASILGDDACDIRIAAAAGLLTLLPGYLMGLPLGADPVFGRFLSQTFVSVGLALFAFALTLRARYGAAGLVLGLVFSVNLMHGFFAAGMIGAGVLFGDRWTALRADIGRRAGLTGWLAAGLAVGALPLIWQVLHRGAMPAYDHRMAPADLADFVKFYFPDHYFWSWKTDLQRREGVALVAALLLACVACYRDVPAAGRRLVAAAVAICGYLGLGLLLDIYPARLLFQAHFFRSDTLAYVLLQAVLAARIAVNWRSRRSESLTAAVALAAVSCHAFTLAAILCGGAAWVGIGLLERNAARRQAAVAFAAVSVAMLAGQRLSGVTWMLPGLAACALWWEGRPLVNGLALAGVVTVGLALNVRAAVPLLGNELITVPLAAVARIGSEVRRTLPSDAVLVVPPGIDGARPLLQRSVYLTSKDGAAYLWTPGYEVEFLRRLSVLRITYTPGLRADRLRIAREFLEHLPESLPALESEGATHLLLPVGDVPPGSRCSPSTPDYCVLSIAEARRVFPSGAVSSAPPGTRQRR